jgi:hypothetical protein
MMVQTGESELRPRPRMAASVMHSSEAYEAASNETISCLLVPGRCRSGAEERSGVIEMNLTAISKGGVSHCRRIKIKTIL